MKLNQLQPAKGHKTKRKRRGRGIGSGRGGTSTRGHKGQMSRSGSTRRPGFEGGQMPLVRRVPKRGFTNITFKNTYQIVNLRAFVAFDANTEITPQVLKDRSLIDTVSQKVKILAHGTIDKAYIVKAHMFSKSAIEKIEKAGGKIEIIS